MHNKHIDGKGLISLSQLSQKYNYSLPSLYKILKKGEIKYFKPNGGKIFLLEEDFIHWIISAEVSEKEGICSQ